MKRPLLKGGASFMAGERGHKILLLSPGEFIW